MSAICCRIASKSSTLIVTTDLAAEVGISAPSSPAFERDEDVVGGADAGGFRPQA